MHVGGFDQNYGHRPPSLFGGQIFGGRPEGQRFGQPPGGQIFGLPPGGQRFGRR